PSTCGPPARAWRWASINAWGSISKRRRRSSATLAVGTARSIEFPVPSRIPQHSSGAAVCASWISQAIKGLETRRAIPMYCNMGGGIIEGVLEGTGRLDKALADASGLSRERIKALIGEGRVWIAGKPATQASAKAPDGTTFRIDVPEAAPAEAAAQDIPLVVVFEDEDLIVVDKPAGMVVHPRPANQMEPWAMRCCTLAAGSCPASAALPVPGSSIGSIRIPRDCLSSPRAMLRMRGWRASSPPTTWSEPISPFATDILSRLPERCRGGSAARTRTARKWRFFQRIPRVESTPLPTIR